MRELVILVALAQFALLELAGGRARDRVDELERVRQPELRELRREERAQLVGRRLRLLGLILLYAWFGLLRPALRDLMQVGRTVEPTFATVEGIEPGPARGPEAPAQQQRGYESDLQAAKDIARQDPRIVANVVKDWVGRE